MTKWRLTAGALALVALLAAGGVGVTVLGTLQAADRARADRGEDTTIVLINAMNAARIEALRRFLDAMGEDVELLAANPATREAVTAMRAARNELGDDPGRVLRRLYVSENPYAPDRRHRLVAAAGDAAYNVAHRTYHPWFRQLLEARDLFEIYLVDSQGAVIYSVYKEKDFAVDLTADDWKESGLAEVWRRLRDRSEETNSAFVDWALYRPLNDVPAAFIGAPVTGDDGEPLGAVVFQLSFESVNRIVQSAVGMGNTGESYIVGADFLIRSESRFLGRGDILKTRVDNRAVREALKGMQGVLTEQGRGGQEVIAAYGPVSFQNVKWAVVSEIERTEAAGMPPAVRNLILLAAGLLSIVALVTAMAAGYLAARPR